jgi:4-amino-4-deoxy-L-arabinose transferase-like glycosyltransferase
VHASPTALEPTRLRSAHAAEVLSQVNNHSKPWPPALLTILGAGTAVRVLLWVWFTPVAPHIHDEQAHVVLATNLVEYGEYAFDPGHPTSLRPPLYPAFVAAMFKIFGKESFQAVRLAQAILSLLTVVFLFRLGRDLISERAGLWVAGLLCFYPTFLGFNNLILSEVLFTFFLTGAVYAVHRGLNSSGYRALVAAGVLLGLGALTRSILFPFAPMLAVFLLLGWRGSFSRRLLAVTAFAIPFAAVLAPWAARNTLLHHTFVPIDCMGGRNFMMGNYEHTPLYRSWDAISITGEQGWFCVLEANRPLPLGTTQGQIDKLALSEGVQFVKENPGLTVHRDLIKFFDFWGLERELVAGANLGLFGPIPAPVVVALGIAICGAFIVVLFAGAYGAAVCPPADRRMHLLFLLLIAFFCAVHTVVFAHSRYHLPVMPFVMLYAAAAITCPQGRSVWKRPAFWFAAGFCGLVATGWAWNAAAGDLAKLMAVLGVKQ